MKPRDGICKSLVLIVGSVAFVEHAVKCEVECEVKEAQNAEDFGLSEHARSGIVFADGQSASNMRVLQCVCGTDDEVLRDRDLVDFERDADLGDWNSSSLFVVRGCQKLDLSLDRHIDTFSNGLSGAALVVMDIDDLNLMSFDAGRKENDDGQGDSHGFTSIVFRNVTFTGLPNNLLFELKVEVRFTNVKVEGDVFNLDFENLENFVDPRIVIEDSQFEGIDSVEGGVDQNSEKFLMRVKNEQLVRDETVESGEGCHFDFRGIIEIRGNTFGLLGPRGINIQGAEAVVVENNFIDMATKDSVKIDRVKSFTMRKNQIGFTLSQPIVFLLYVKKETVHQECDVDDLPEEAIKPIVFAENKFANLKQMPIETDIDPEYSEAFLDKFTFKNNSVSAKCDCGDRSANVVSSNDEQLFQRLVNMSWCISMNNDEALTGSRQDICSGKVPKTQKEMEEDIRQEVKGAWTTYLVVAILIAMVVAAAATALLMKYFYSSNGEVSPRQGTF